MTSFTLSLAGVPAGVEAIHPAVGRFCREFFSEETPAFRVTMTASDIESERVRAARSDARDGLPARDYADAYLESIALYRKLSVGLLDKDAVVFHGAALGAGERAFLFTARSGVGKTTHARLWLKNIPGAFILNGDKPLLRLRGDVVFACGTPWKGKENYGRNAMLPLEAICLLERDAANHIEPVSFRDALPTLLQQTNRPEDPDALRKTLEIVCGLEDRVRFYRMGCNMEDEAAQMSFRAMAEGCGYD